MMFKNFPFFKGKKDTSFDHLVEEVNKGYIPEHIAIIMDGTGHGQDESMPRMRDT
ncbi:Undecaprenyl pyrophosphate synthetase [Bacillus thuringiensis serovar israelensis ATCC 35646]|nr:Undecaprenyl pyrophosphate synthetase [Bacillus thuringiensis serovar israelensis ATCC 35646]